jgi:hypothetical protein
VQEFAKAGDLISYGTSITDARRQVGVYVGRVLIDDGELYRLFFRWRSSEAKLTRRQRIRPLTRLNRLTEANPIEAFSERGTPAHTELVEILRQLSSPVSSSTSA